MPCKKNNAPFCADNARAYKPLAGVDPVTFGPNVTGSTRDRISTPANGPYDLAGCFYATDFYPYGGGQPGLNSFVLYIDASRSNPIYTDNGRVYPLSCTLNFIIKS